MECGVFGSPDADAARARARARESWATHARQTRATHPAPFSLARSPPAPARGARPEVAAESWKRHLARNSSIVVDHCYGQLKSHVTCPNCEHESITFDPYLSLSLPLPILVRVGDAPHIAS